MIKLTMKKDNEFKTVLLQEEIIIDAILIENPKVTKKIIKKVLPKQKISDAFFGIVNGYIETFDDDSTKYAGVIVRTGLEEYVTLYLKGTYINEEYLVSQITEYIYDIGETLENINITRIGLNKKIILDVLRNNVE